MCGIAGLVLKTNERVEPAILEKMAGAMRHRGPDAQGVWSEGNIGLAHRRLRIIDLSSGADQPMSDISNKLTLVFNGEIYNFREIRRDLEKSGFKFRTHSDTEVILYAYAHWGVAAFEKFNGMFAFALYDSRPGQNVLHVVRDRFGIKPLFYARNQGRFAFASEIKPLLTLDWVERDINAQDLFHFLKFSHVPQPRSMISGVEQLKPGFRLEVRNGEISEHLFWDIVSFHQKQPLTVSEQDVLVSFNQCFRSAVERQLIADVPVGCFLSGGIDSSLIVAVCSELGVKDLQTFTIGYKNSEFDESPFAQEIASRFQTNHRTLIAEPKDYFDLINEIPDFFDQPLGDPTLLSSLILCRLTSKHVKVAFSGDGGDELFFGYAYQKVLHALRARSILPAPLRKNAAFLLGFATKGSRHGVLQQLAKLSDIFQYNDDAELFEYFIGTVGPLRLDRLAKLVRGTVKLSPPVYETMLNQISSLRWDQKIEQVFLRTFMVDTVLAKTDHAGMAYGLEARVPFLDNEVVDFAATVPFDLKLKNGTGKYLLRKILRQKLSQKGFDSRLSARKKQGFSIPLRDWFRTDLKFLLDQYLDSARLQREGLLNEKAVSELVAEHLGKRANHSHLLWSLVSFQMWKERFLP